MARWKPDPTFYPSPALAGEAPAERLAYVAMLASAESGRRDALGVVDTDPGSKSYSRLVGQVDLPDGGNELHHFGWNACSSHLCPYAPNAHVERRYLIVPGTHFSRIHIIDTQPDPRRPELIRVAATLLGFGLFRLTGHHPRWAAMRVSRGDLALWSFLMASAHGAGLMALPLVLTASALAGQSAHHHTVSAGVVQGPST